MLGQKRFLTEKETIALKWHHPDLFWWGLLLNGLLVVDIVYRVTIPNGLPLIAGRSQCGICPPLLHCPLPLLSFLVLVFMGVLRSVGCSCCGRRCFVPGRLHYSG